MRYPRLILAMLLAISSLSISHAVDNADNLSEISIFAPESGQINAAQTISSNSTIDTNASPLLFVLTWLNSTSTLEATLITPHGAKIDSNAQPPVIYGANTSLIYYILPNAEAGKWTAMITAKDAPKVGESYWTLFSTVPEYEYTNQESTDLENLDL